MNTKERRLTAVPNSLFLVYGRIASITNTTSTVDKMAKQTAADTPLTRAITLVCSIVKLEQFLKVYKVAIYYTVSSRDFLFPTSPQGLGRVRKVWSGNETIIRCMTGVLPSSFAMP